MCVVYIRTLGPEHRNTLNAASNLAGSLSQLEECADAAVLMRTTLVVRTRAVGSHEMSRSSQRDALSTS